jgi:hypothetical protein
MCIVMDGFLPSFATAVLIVVCKPDVEDAAKRPKGFLADESRCDFKRGIWRLLQLSRDTVQVKSLSNQQDKAVFTESDEVYLWDEDGERKTVSVAALRFIVGVIRKAASRDEAWGECRFYRKLHPAVCLVPCLCGVTIAMLSCELWTIQKTEQVISSKDFKLRIWQRTFRMLSLGLD